MKNLILHVDFHVNISSSVTDFGLSIALSDQNQLFVGTSVGSIFVYSLSVDQSTATLIQTISDNPSSSDLSLAADSGWLIIGNSTYDGGKVHIWKLDLISGQYQFDSTISNPDLSRSEFGISVDIAEDSLIVGALKAGI